MSSFASLRKQIQGNSSRSDEPLTRSWLKHSVLEAVQATEVNGMFAVKDILKYLQDEYHQDPKSVSSLVKDILREIEMEDGIRRLSDSEPCDICGGIRRTVNAGGKVRKVATLKRSTRRKMGTIRAGRRKTAGKVRSRVTAKPKKRRGQPSSRNKSRASKKVSERRKTGIVIADDADDSRKEDRIPQESNSEQYQIE